MKYPLFTLTITSCKRFSLFMQTITSFFEMCDDIDLISEIIIVDDNSSLDDIKQLQNYLLFIMKDFPITLIHRKNNPGHAESLNILFDSVKTDYIFHLEDDWLFTKDGHFIRAGFDIMQDCNDIKSVIMRNWIAQGTQYSKKYSTGVCEYYKHNFNGLKFKKGDLSTYPGYSLNPSLQCIKDIRTIGRFENRPLFELRFAYKYFSYDYRVALMQDDYCKHIGHSSNNAYTLNNTGV